MGCCSPGGLSPASSPGEDTRSQHCRIASRPWRGCPPETAPGAPKASHGGICRRDVLESDGLSVCLPDDMEPGYRICTATTAAHSALPASWTALRAGGLVMRRPKGPSDSLGETLGSANAVRRCRRRCRNSAESGSCRRVPRGVAMDQSRSEGTDPKSSPPPSEGWHASTRRPSTKATMVWPRSCQHIRAEDVIGNPHRAVGVAACWPVRPDSLNQPTVRSRRRPEASGCL